MALFDLYICVLYLIRTPEKHVDDHDRGIHIDFRAKIDI